MGSYISSSTQCQIRIEAQWSKINALLTLHMLFFKLGLFQEDEKSSFWITKWLWFEVQQVHFKLNWSALSNLLYKKVVFQLPTRRGHTQNSTYRWQKSTHHHLKRAQEPYNMENLAFLKHLLMCWWNRLFCEKSQSQTVLAWNIHLTTQLKALNHNKWLRLSAEIQARS